MALSPWAALAAGALLQLQPAAEPRLGRDDLAVIHSALSATAVADMRRGGADGELLVLDETVVLCSSTHHLEVACMREGVDLPSAERTLVPRSPSRNRRYENGSTWGCGGCVPIRDAGYGLDRLSQHVPQCRWFCRSERPSVRRFGNCSRLCDVQVWKPWREGLARASKPRSEWLARNGRPTALDQLIRRRVPASVASNHWPAIDRLRRS
jgi:hypothetical protein